MHVIHPDTGRRAFLQHLGLGAAAVAAASLGLGPRQARGVSRNLTPLAASDHRTEFEQRDLQAVVRALGGTAATASDAIDILLPELAENGAVVPIEITSHLPATHRIAIVTEQNPRALTAVFHTPDDTEPWVSTRIKVATSGPVIALVEAGGHFHFARRTVTVTIGGCGG